MSVNNSGISNNTFSNDGQFRIQNSYPSPTPKSQTFAETAAAISPIIRSAEALSTLVPGGALISSVTAAARQGGALGNGGVSLAGGYGGAPMYSKSSTLSAGGTTPGVGAGLPGGSPDATRGNTNNLDNVLADNQSLNMYYLQLQEQISAESRSYTTLSNVLKAKHDTVKNAIGNIR